MTENLADELSQATERHCTLYSTWADGGSGLLLTGNFQIDRRPGNICIDGEQTEQAMARLAALAKAGAKNGAQIWPQLSHAGRQSTAKVNQDPVGPSAVQLEGIPTFAIGKPREMSPEEVAEIPGRFAHAAKVCEMARFGGIQIHAAHGYLLSSFLNPRANKREDEYGGALENRARLLLNTIRAVREAVGAEFGVAVKLNTADFQKGGFTHVEAIEVACLLSDEGVDLLELSGGNYESPTITGSKATVAAGADDEQHDVIRKSTKLREAYYLLYCRDVRNALKSKHERGNPPTAVVTQAAAGQVGGAGAGAGAGGQEPATAKATMRLMLTGGFRSKSAMEGALHDDDLDVVGVGRPLCGSPYCITDLLAAAAADNYSLPAYEDVLQLGYNNIFGRMCRGLLSWTGLGRVALTITVQTWYYVNIYKIADGETFREGVGDPDQLGCAAAWLRNEKEEGRIASGLVGPDCRGTHYKGVKEPSL